MAAETLELSNLDWDDTELIKAYDKGMKLQKKRASKKNKGNNKEWDVGDFCCAVYPEDNLLYEAVIISIDDGICNVMFLGYEDEVAVEMTELKKSKGKRARKSQIRAAKQFNATKERESESETSEERNVSSHRRLNNTGYQDTNFMHNPSAGYHNPTALHPMPHHYSAPNAMFSAPPAPPMPDAPCNQDPSIYNMLSAWYLAGYYTGLHEAKNQQFVQPGHMKRCCCHH
ncbi:survival motor neuron protein-like [Uloborus diversus]|uniref:survival motor neuron protein-like n=1 Tax=Uloborus diversus TaxID=327109 RepID=UPI00240A2EC3|nr:survival motor neuron protein-like [Uloborus diversus]